MGELRYILCTGTLFFLKVGSDIIPNGTDTDEQLTRREEPPSKPAGKLILYEVFYNSCQ